MIDRSVTNPGFHKGFVKGRFQDNEWMILKKLAKEWYLTNGGGTINIATSTYEYFLMKPTPIFSEMFNIDREVICVFSNYTSFEPRSIDVFDIIQKKLPSQLRTENICRVLISRDEKTELLLESFIKSNPEHPIVVPFTYNELLSTYDAFFIRNKFVKHFYSRNLFSFFSPLRKEIYFYGRAQLVQELVNKHLSSEHSGLFGIRKSGKTSIIYAIERALDNHKIPYISIDCESPSIHMLRWNNLLYKINNLLKEKVASTTSISEKNYDEKNAADSFESDFKRILKKVKLDKQVLIIFDEIERLSPNTGSSEHWKSQNDFVYFWQTLRGCFQRNQNLYTYLLVGTNPSCVENHAINGQDNPLFGSIPHQFVPPFTVEQVREMVRRLGKYMGVKFDEMLYSMLTDDFGGHPYLIRKICSDIISNCNSERPIKIDKSIYETTKKNFAFNSSDFLEMIIQVLKEWYPDEYDMLTFLANEDMDTFNQFAKDNPDYTKHLVGYGIISKGLYGYVFNIESLKEYLSKKHSFERINMSQAEMMAEISYRRNRIEKSLRGIIKTILKIGYKSKASAQVLSALPEDRRKLDQDINYLLHKDNSPLYFLDLVNIIQREWSLFESIFEIEKQKSIYILSEINRLGRPDAHARAIDKDVFTQIRLHFKIIEKIIINYE